MEALERVLGRDLGVLGDQRLVAHVEYAELVVEALGIAEQQALAVALDLDSSAEPPGPEVERVPLATRHTTRWIMPSPARPGIAPGYSKKVRSSPGWACSSP